MSSKPISEQISDALASRGKSKADLVEILGVSVRQVQRKMTDNNFSLDDIEKISKALDWQMIIDPYGRSNAVVNEEPPKYEDTPITFSINLNRKTAKKLPGLVDDLEELIKRRLKSSD